jgi:hypothetical protein
MVIETVGIPKPTASKQPHFVSADELYQAAFDIWTNVAWQSQFSLPDQEQVQFATSVGPEEAIVTGI